MRDSLLKKYAFTIMLLLLGGGGSNSSASSIGDGSFARYNIILGVPVLAADVASASGFGKRKRDSDSGSSSTRATASTTRGGGDGNNNGGHRGKFGMTQEYIHQTTLRYRKHLAQKILKQRVGWQRVRLNIRDYLGMLIGYTVAFRGHSNPAMAPVALQASQLLWDFLSSKKVFPHEPWLYDIAAGIGGLVAAKGEDMLLRFLRNKNIGGIGAGVGASAISRFFLVYVLFHGSGVVLHEWDESEITGGRRIAYSVAGTVLTSAAIKASGIPLEVAASSLSGGLLLYESCRGEIAGNWWRTVKILGRRASMNKLLKIRRFTKHNEKLHAVKHDIKYAKGSIQNVSSVVFFPLPAIDKYLSNKPVITHLKTFFGRLHKAFKPILGPWIITVWGTACQMDQIYGHEGPKIGYYLKFLGLAVDPVKFFVSKVTDLFDATNWGKKSIVAFIQRLLHKIKKE